MTELYICDECNGSFEEEDMWVKESHDVYTPGFAPEAVPAMCRKCQGVD